MNRYEKEMRQVTVTDLLENLWGCTGSIRNPKERDAKYFSLCNSLLKDISHPKWFLKREVKNGPDILKIVFHSKEELYKIFAHKISWDEFLKIVKPLDDEPTAWRAE